MEKQLHTYELTETDQKNQASVEAALYENGVQILKTGEAGITFQATEKQIGRLFAPENGVLRQYSMQDDLFSRD